MANEWQSKSDPRTGRPFESEAQYLDWQAWSAGQQQAASASASAVDKASRSAGPGYDFGGTRAYYVDPESGYYHFGTTVSSQAPTRAGNPEGATENQAGSGYIDPNTGQIYYNVGPAPSSQPPPRAGSPNEAGSGYVNNSGAVQQNSRQYDYTTDYGLGPANAGIIPIAHDASGTPTAFYAGTFGGGGKVFTTLAEAQASVQQYKQWYETQNPPKGGGGTSGPTTTTTQTPPPTGLLTDPGFGEKYYDSTKDFYTGKSNAQNWWEQTANQPLASQQMWQAYNGIFSNPNYLDDYYGRKAQQAQTTLDRKASSGGWADSGASARATANIDLLFADEARKGMQDFATTGMGLASSADAGNLAKLAAASGVDATNLAKITAGQVASGSAQNLEENRLTGGLTASILLGNQQANAVYQGLSAIEQQNFITQMMELQLRVQQGQLTAAQAYQQGVELLQSLATISKLGTSYQGGQQNTGSNTQTEQKKQEENTGKNTGYYV